MDDMALDHDRRTMKTALFSDQAVANSMTDDAVSKRIATTRFFGFIDVLRAFAALIVVVYHVIEIGSWKSFPMSGPLLTFRVGWLGVDLFFVISGFVIAYSGVRDYNRNNAGFRRRFFIRRLARIVPLYILTCVAYVFLVNPELLVTPPGVTAMHVLSHLLFIHNLHPLTFGSINGANWSVALEMQFYVLMLFLVPVMAKRSPYLILSLVAVAISYRYMTTLILVPGPSSNPHFQHVASSQLPGVLDEFAVGMVIAFIMNAKSNALKKMYESNWRNFAIWAVVAVLMLAGTMALYWPRAQYWDNVWMISWWRSLMGLSLGCVLSAAITFPGEKWFVFRPLRYLGEISYGIYLWHLLVLATLVAVPGFVGMKLLICTLTGTILLASITWHYFEKPFILRYRK